MVPAIGDFYSLFGLVVVPSATTISTTLLGKSCNKFVDTVAAFEDFQPALFIDIRLAPKAGYHGPPDPQISAVSLARRARRRYD